MFECNGRQIFYIDQGEGEKTIILLNGIMMSTDSWMPYTDLLKRDHRVIAFDFSGQGRSLSEDNEYSFDIHINELKALLDHLGIGSAHFLGTSYGGEVGLYFAHRYPERVKFLGVVASVSEVDDELKEKVDFWKTESLKVCEGASKQDFFRMTLEYNFSKPYREANAIMLAERTTQFEQVPKEWFAAFAALCDGFQDLNLTDKLQDIEPPVYFWGATQDQVKPSHLTKIIPNNLKNLVGQTWLDCGHAMIIEKFPQVLKEFQINTPRSSQ